MWAELVLLTGAAAQSAVQTPVFDSNPTKLALVPQIPWRPRKLRTTYLR